MSQKIHKQTKKKQTNKQTKHALFLIRGKWGNVGTGFIPDNAVVAINGMVVIQHNPVTVEIAT